MTRRVPDLITDDVRVLSTEDEHRQWRAILSRQGLAGGPKLESVSEASERGLGLHAARLPSPYTTLLARLHEPTLAETLFEPPNYASITTVRCMRKTLHVLPLPLASVAHTATRHFRERDALRAARNLGVTPGLLNTLIGTMLRLLIASGPMSHREIEAVMAPKSGQVPAVRVALKVAWERGELMYRNRAPYWNREDRTFGATESLLPTFSRNGDRAHAAERLIQAYFKSYGPASIRDAVWWSGLSQSCVRSALRASGRPVVSLITPGSPNRLYMFADSAVDVPVDGHSSLVVDFLAHEDVALKAYFETRNRYMGVWPHHRAFNQIGEVLPTILVDGRVIGTWSWLRCDRKVVWELFESANGALSRACRERADLLTTALRSRYDG